MSADARHRYDAGTAPTVATNQHGHTRAVANLRWLNRSQPQTLYSAVMLSYFRGASALLFGSEVYSSFVAEFLGGRFAQLVTLLALAAFVAGGLGIANERKWGYWVCVTVSIFAVTATLYWTFRSGFNINLGLRLMFDIALVAMLLHPISREYRRIWFR